LLQSFQTRVNLTGLSLIQLLEPAPITFGVFKDKTISDFPSTLVFTRTLFELYTNANWLVNRKCSADEKNLYYLTWKLHGYLDRQKIQEYRGEPISEQSQLKLIEEKKIIDSIKVEIRNNTIFKGLRSNEKNILLDERWCVIGIKKRGYITELGESEVDQFYKYTSTYAHGDSLSIFQSSSINSSNEAKGMFFMAIMYSCGLITLQTNLFKKQFPNMGKLQGEDYFNEGLLYWLEFFRTRSKRRESPKN